MMNIKKKIKIYIFVNLNYFVTNILKYMRIVYTNYVGKKKTEFWQMFFP